MQNLNLPLEWIADTRVGRAVRHASEAHPATSGVYPLTTSLDAFAARALLMRAAERTLDIQCYMWQADITGRLLLFKPLGYLPDFHRLNHRMHNKSLTVDTQVTIVGGRNVGDAYFGADSELEFSDLDVIAVGPVAQEVTLAFEA